MHLLVLLTGLAILTYAMGRRVLEWISGWSGEPFDHFMAVLIGVSIELIGLVVALLIFLFWTGGH